MFLNFLYLKNPEENEWVLHYWKRLLPKPESAAAQDFPSLIANSRTRESYLRHYYEKHGWKERTEVAAFVLPLI